VEVLILDSQRRLHARRRGAGAHPAGAAVDPIA
jgi:hypothetical protein